MTTPANTLLIMADEYARRVMACAGDPWVKTPHLDRLAQQGTRFTRAYTTSPVCAPARASLATGRWVHQHGFWTCSEVYDGSIPSWGHRLRETGHKAVSCGKLHYRGPENDNGFAPEILPQHCFRGYGWLKGLLRERPLPPYEQEPKQELTETIFPGESRQVRYDMAVRDAACAWLRENGGAPGKPWALFASFISPHYPFTVPERYWSMYETVDFPIPESWDARPDHPVLAELRRFFCYGDFMDREKVRGAHIAYYALCSFIDDCVGDLLAALEESGARERTRIVFTSDHGEMLGVHGYWTKQVMYEDSAGIPLIVEGPDIPAGRVVDTPVSLLDLYPTLIDWAGERLTREERVLPGVHLADTIAGKAEGRLILSEYHDGGAITGMFMLVGRRWKYIRYPGFAPQLFDLANDPGERHDLAADPRYAAVLAEHEAALETMLDPEAVNTRVFADQARRVAQFGGREAVIAMESI